MTKSGVTHTNTAAGDGRGQLTENKSKPSAEGGTRPRAEDPAQRSGEGQGGTNRADEKNKQQG
jgi:hypothetical protein